MDIANAMDKNKVKQVSKTLEAAFRHDLSLNAMDESLLEKENPKNPMLLSPVISCIFKFLNIEDIKNCRLVSREWGSTGKISLASRAKIHIYAKSSDRRSVDFCSCFLNSATLFSAFEIRTYSTNDHDADCRTIKELTNFFKEQQKYIKELTLDFKHSNEEEKKIDLCSWISKSPMVQRDTKHMTKLSIGGEGNNLNIPLHLIAHIKDLKLYGCNINFEDGTKKICPIKLWMLSATFYQNGIKLDRVRINDVVDFSQAKEISLDYNIDSKSTKYVLDLWGNVTLDNLSLRYCEIVNGEKSQWVINQLATMHIPYSLNSGMKIKDFSLHNPCPIDLFTLPNSIQKLALCAIGNNDTDVICSQPLVLENLQYLHIFFGLRGNLSLFMNCPQLNHLKFFNCSCISEQKFSWMPKNLKTLTLQNSTLHWVKDCHLNLEKLVIYDLYPDPIHKAKEFLNPKITVQDIILHDWKMQVNKNLVDFLEYRNRFNYGKRLYIGQLDWNEDLEESVLKEYVDVESLFYVFESGGKGRAISEMAFNELIPKHMDIVI